MIYLFNFLSKFQITMLLQVLMFLTSPLLQNRLNEIEKHKVPKQTYPACQAETNNDTYIKNLSVAHRKEKWGLEWKQECKG